jgi:GT2 family glycosyltransferase
MIKIKILGIVVNYQSADFTLEAVKSICSEAEQMRLTAEVVTVVVNNSREDHERMILEKQLPGNVVLINNSENTGFGRACNMAFEKYDSDMVLLLNPDARLLPNSLASLVDTLQNRCHAGAVAPRIVWDENGECMLPPVPSVGMASLLPLLIKTNFSTALVKFAWRFYAYRFWNRKSPFFVSNLNGSVVLLKRDAVVAAGGLFDPDFFLYYEDTDLFLRMKKINAGLMVDPGARAVHMYDQCARDELPRKRQLMEQGLQLFEKKHASLCVMRFARFLGRFAKFADRGMKPIPETMLKAPFTVTVPEKIAKGGWVAEWSVNPEFIPSIAMFGKGDCFSFTKEYTRMLAPGKYYLRITRDTPHALVSCCWSFMVAPL